MTKPRKPRDPPHGFKPYHVYYSLKYRLAWLVYAEDAKQDVIITGNKFDAMRGEPGQVLRCFLANCAKRNESNFPHDFIIAAFNKTMCIVITSVHPPTSTHQAGYMLGVRYMHSYKDYVDYNDDGLIIEIIERDPSIVERMFKMRAPRGKELRGIRHGGKSGPHKTTPRSNLSIVPRESLGRAMRAGLLTVNIEDTFGTAIPAPAIDFSFNLKKQKDEEKV